MWLEKIFTMRFAAVLISILLIVNGTLALALGAYTTYEAVLTFIGLKDGKAGVDIIEAVDIYLFALVIFLLAGGIYKLFAGNENTFRNNPVLFKLNSFTELKVLLWETLLLTLTIYGTLEFFITKSGELQLELLIIPGCVLILAAALKLVKKPRKD